MDKTKTNKKQVSNTNNIYFSWERVEWGAGEGVLLSN